MIYDYTGASQISIMRHINDDQDEWWWGWIAKHDENGKIIGNKFWLSHGSGNILKDGDEFLIDKDTHLYLSGQYHFSDNETIICLSPKCEKKDLITIKIKRI